MGHREKYELGRELGREKGKWDRVLASGDPERVAEAQLNIGIIWTRAGWRKKATAALRKAIDSGHPVYAPSAADQLALWYQRDGDRPAEAALYRQLAGR
jgi:Tfp pilus assembly protein PilF